MGEGWHPKWESIHQEERTGGLGKTPKAEGRAQARMEARSCAEHSGWWRTWHGRGCERTAHSLLPTINALFNLGYFLPCRETRSCCLHPSTSPFTVLWGILAVISTVIFHYSAAVMSYLRGPPFWIKSVTLEIQVVESDSMLKVS